MKIAVKFVLAWIMQVQFYCFEEIVGMSPLFQPDGCSREYWEANCGCDSNQQLLRKQHCKNLKKYLAETIVGAEKVYSYDEEQTHPCQCIDDMNMDDYQIQSITNSLEKKKRRKRKIRTFHKFPISKWPTEIYYKLDGSLGDTDKIKVKEALDMWEKSTCLTFKQLDISEKTTEQHLIFIRNAQ